MNALSRSLALATALIVAALGAAVSAAPAWASASVSIAGPSGTASVDPDYATEVTVSGSGFQSIAKGFGGIYVLFGWVDDPSGGSWRPSAGGVVGEDYRYVPDAESADNNGFQRFLAFPGSQTESSANGTLGADGSWSVQMVVPGAVFESQDREGRVTEVDCRRVSCGIITIGAHGVKNANNETFTPVAFGSPDAAPAAETPAQSAAAAGAVRVGVETGNVVAGSSIVFTGQGFTPGEQVVASLDGGLTAVGPLTAGTRGEVAAALPVPRDVRDGTHLVTLRGAGSGGVAEAEVTVTGGTVTTVDETAPAVPTWAIVVLLACIVLSLALVVASVVTALVRARSRRRARRGAAGAVGAVGAAGAQPGAAGSVAAAPPSASVAPVPSEPGAFGGPASAGVADPSTAPLGVGTPR